MKYNIRSIYTKDDHKANKKYLCLKAFKDKEDKCIEYTMPMDTDEHLVGFDQDKAVLRNFQTKANRDVFYEKELPK